MKYLLLLFLMMPLCINSQVSEDKESEWLTVDNVLLNTKDYSIQVKYKKAEFKLQVCNLASCVTSRPMTRSITSQNIFRATINLVKTLDTSLQDSDISTDETKYLMGLKERVLDFIRQHEESKKSERDQQLGKVDNAQDRYAGRLKLFKKLDKSYFKIIEPDKRDIKTYYSNLYEKVENSDGKKEYQLKASDNCVDMYVELIDATVIFFNNKASTIAVNAFLKCGDTILKELKFNNSNFSIPIRAFEYYDNPGKWIYRAKYTLLASGINGTKIEIHVNDIFDYESFGENKIGYYGKSIANQKVFITNQDEDSNSVKIAQRRFFDFFTGVVHSDLLGANTTSSNSLLNAQVSILKPMNLGNWGKISLLRQFRLNLNIALNNSFENEERYISFENSEPVNHFDLFRKQNLSSVLSLDLFSYESKGWFLTWNLGYNIGFYRTGYEYTNTVNGDTDEVSTGQFLSITHGPYVNFEFRPQDNFGVDVMVSLDEINLNDDDVVSGINVSDQLLINDRSNSFLAKHNMVNVSTNLYWLTNPGKSNGGIYARVGLAYHVPTEASFPQLMVGYATNLTSFVNRFKTKAPKEGSENE